MAPLLLLCRPCQPRLGFGVLQRLPKPWRLACWGPGRLHPLRLKMDFATVTPGILHPPVNRVHPHAAALDDCPIDDTLDEGLGELLNHAPQVASRFEALCAKVQASPDDYLITTEDVADLYPFPIDKFQRLSIDAFLKDLSLVVCAPTSSGKTLVAEAAAAAALAKGKKLVYTTPLKALSNQKLREFRLMFGDSNVGLLTGDAAINREAPLVVMTTEILRNMLYQSVGSLEEGSLLVNVDAIVLDEVHYLSDISRGTVWEETVIYCPKDISLICLSATVANPEELAGWIAQVHGPTELITSSRRPVPLMWHYSTRYALQPLLNEQSSAMNRRLQMTRRPHHEASDLFWGEEELERSRRKRRGKVGAKRLKGGGWGVVEEMMSEEELHFLRRKQVPQVSDTLYQLQDRDMLPAIWFIFSRRGCDTATRYVQDVPLLSDEEICKVELALSKFRELHPEAVRESAVKSLLSGVAAHHAGCLPTWKSFIEDLFQDGLIKLIFATETLAAGINMPARTTVLSSLSKRGEDGQMMLSANAMLQMAGRAGRRGIDLQGHVVVIQTAFEGPEECCKLLFAGPDPLVSQFTATYGMALNLLGAAKINAEGSTDSQDTKPQLTRRGRTLEEARALIEKSFGNYIGSEVLVAAKQQLLKLQENVKCVEDEIRSWSEDEGVNRGLTPDEWQEYLEAKLQMSARWRAKASRISARIRKMQPAGWKEFLRVLNVLEAAEALKPQSHELLELGEIAASIRGENELWLALVFSNKTLPNLKPQELAAVCGSLVTDGIKTRPENGPSEIYEVSSDVASWVEGIEETRRWLQAMQVKHGVEINCEIDTQFAGMVEAWAVGVTWKELTTDCGMDEGDVARLLRRSIDLLAQIPHLPNIEVELAKKAKSIAVVMDRPPISELLG